MMGIKELRDLFIKLTIAIPFAIFLYFQIEEKGAEYILIQGYSMYLLTAVIFCCLITLNWFVIYIMNILYR